MNLIAIYGSHEASVTVSINGVIRMYEIEKITRVRYDYLWKYENDKNKNAKELLLYIECMIKKEFGYVKFDICYYVSIIAEGLDIIRSVFNVEKFIKSSHHISHAATSFYLSGYDEATLISYDGGGEDLDGISFFNIYRAQASHIEKITRIDYDIGTAYLLLGLPIKDLIKGNSNLALPGKLMGLCAYGEPIPSLMGDIKSFFKSKGQSVDYLKQLGERIGYNLTIDGLCGEASYNFAATVQAAFEEVIFELIEPYVDKDLPICLSGGCALNVLMNEKIRNKYKVPVFVPPNPNDCGLGLGMILNEIKQYPIKETLLCGPVIYDADKIEELSMGYKTKKVSIVNVAELIADGKIIGIINGRLECGPRALGNRSIVCDPGTKGMKDIINKKVKNREWFRPFAPSVQEERKRLYFEFDGQSPFMSFAPVVKEEWRSKLGAIVHIDSTSRIHTVTKENNEFFYNLLEEFYKIRGYGVLLNTSFNIKGKPILNTLEEALQVLNTTEMDYVYFEGTLFSKV